ncbi:(R)-benzylsuccinyl-CoA dehydrogenase [Variovorax sp. PBL-H6]|uniref:acyl-CoA dehydrogenase family protein n=1 Tax=Variovorax sp. PBL-H6 TaxID=434009 RepID=UPI0013182B65|nr:acyl-CoA dehydrogenase family protein [Variovorax sp. PBL-H6]VTU19165.1 (R)-benzylsuccinyl-CoA dehydrogenase [Variovorax sp. PBL-H6]
MNLMDVQRDPALAELRRRVRDFVAQHAIPLETRAHVHDPRALDTALAQLRPIARSLGLYLPQLPREHGGLGLGWVERSVVLEEAGRSYLGPGALNCAAPDQPNMISLLRQGSAGQRRAYLGPLAAGEIRSCFAMTEPAPGAGSDPSMLATRAERRPGGWVINGRKWFITGAVGASFAIVLATTDAGPTQFIVETSNPGFRLLRAIPAIDPYAIGGHGDIELADCFVTDEAVLGEAGEGFAYAQQRLEPARLSHCMRLLGRARRALELAQDYVNERRSFGERLADLQQVQAMVADCHMDLHASRLMTLDCAARMDAGLPVKTESAMAKVFVSEALYRVADRSAQLMGALGMSEDAPVSLILRELRPFRIYDGASELHRATLGRRFLSSRQGDIR